MKIKCVQFYLAFIMVKVIQKNIAKMYYLKKI